MNLAALAGNVERFYAERVEPLVYRLRQRPRLQSFGLLSLAQAPLAHLQLGRCQACDEPSCGGFVRRYERYYRRFFRVLPGNGGAVSGAGTLAALDLPRYAGFSDYRRQLRKRSGNFWRDARSAGEKGFGFRRFEYQNHTPDICEIRKSLKLRAFGPVFDAFFLNVNALGGPPRAWRPVVEPPCTRHWELFFGIFMPLPGFRQGAITTDEKLVAYARLHRIGNTARYAEFMGHGRYFSDGVMMLLQCGLVESLLDARHAWASDVRYVTYGAIEQGSAGLAFWKRKALFMPHMVME